MAALGLMLIVVVLIVVVFKRRIASPGIGIARKVLAARAGEGGASMIHE